METNSLLNLGPKTSISLLSYVLVKAATDLAQIQEEGLVLQYGQSKGVTKLLGLCILFDPL